MTVGNDRLSGASSALLDLTYNEVCVFGQTFRRSTRLRDVATLNRVLLVLTFHDMPFLTLVLTFSALH
jgi:hypothetical protein